MKRAIQLANKTSASSMVLVSLLVIGILIVPVRSQVSYGPITPSLTVHLNQTFSNLTSCNIDLTGWDAYSDYQPSPSIWTKEYCPIKQAKLYLNNQKWPTGVEDPRLIDPETLTYKHWYGTDAWDDEAKEFRKAIAYLTDKQGYLDRILNGVGWIQETEIPYPALAGYTDYRELEYKGLIYRYDPMEAAQVLDAAGFTQGSTINTYYDPATPGSAQFVRTDPRLGRDLAPLVFCIRFDDPQRNAASLELTNMLRKSGIPVKPIITNERACFWRTMELYNYHLYIAETDEFPLSRSEDTGKWMLGADAPDQIIYGMFDSAQYWGGTPHQSYGGLSWSSNYAGFCDSEYDYWAEQGKYGSYFDTVYTGCLNAQERAAELVDSIPLWTQLGLKACKTGWTGLINEDGYGIDNYWSFLKMANPSDTIMDWGLSGNLWTLSPISSKRLWEWKTLGLTYDSLIGWNPFGLGQDFGWLAVEWSVGFWALGKTYARFKLRSAADSTTARDPLFHNGAPVRPLDVAFSLIFSRDCGQDVAIAYCDLKDIVEVRIPDPVPLWLWGTGIVQDPSLPAKTVEVRFNTESYWSLHWAGKHPVFSEVVWKAANDRLNWGYNTPGWNPRKVQEYEPWNFDGDQDGVIDLSEDGTGAWIFTSLSNFPISRAKSVSFTANAGFYLSQLYIDNYLTWAFHLMGDINDDGVVDGLDRGFIVNAYGTDMWTYPWGTGPDQYNPNADINTGTWDFALGTGTYGDGTIDFRDNGRWAAHYGKDIDP